MIHYFKTLNTNYMKTRNLILAVVLILFSADIFACTSAIFTGKITADGRPLLWKHRDTGEENNKVEYVKGEKYSFIAILNSPDDLEEAWAGTNEVGFSIMNTASYNLNYEKADVQDREGIVMYKALATCKTLKDFEKLLDNIKAPKGLESNFGVIDAEGGAAYYEVSNNSWTKVDVNDPKIAPQGYLVYANHSNTGKINDGMGYIRYTNADKIVKQHLSRNGEFTPQWVMQGLSRSYYHSVLGIDLIKDKEVVEKCGGWFIDQDFIPRRSSTCSIVVQGIKPGENPLNSVMWTILGYPSVGITVPLMVANGENQPAFMLSSKDSKNAYMCDWNLAKKREIFPIKRGNGKYYMNVNKIIEHMDKALVVENIVFDMSTPIVNKIYKGEATAQDLKSVYDYVWSEIK